MRCFYASDIHGSEVCWRKFLNAGRFYRANVLILGGDVIGKAIVPIAMQDESTATGSLLGRQHVLNGKAAIHAFAQEVRDCGFYPLQATPEEIDELNVSDEARQAAFERVVRSELRRWIAIAEEKVDPNVSVFVMPGNDDPWFIDEELRQSRSLRMCDGTVVTADGHELLSLSYSNPTPWNSPRELPEDSLYSKIEALASQLQGPATAIFNLHVPPYASGLDNAPRLDETLRPVMRAGQVEIVPVGSHAVRRAIEAVQPLVSLHGHIHESRGIQRIGRTLVINPGSEYTSGCIHGALIELRRDKVRGHQLVVG
jgi:Icc-related predicted phosphoesterase